MVRLLIGALVAATAIVFAACGTAASPSPSLPTGSAPPAGSQQPASAEPPGEQPVAGGTLVVAIPGDMVFADPTLVSDSNSSYIMINAVEGLIKPKVGSISEVEPLLAEALPEVSDDLLTYTFKLQSGVTFHDGEPLNAEAVVYNFERQKNAPEELQDAYNYYFGAVFNGWGDESDLASVTAVDESTVEFKLKRPLSNFLLALAALPQFGIQSPKALKDGDADNPDPSKSTYAQGQGAGMVGTGPFKYKEWVPEDHVTLDKNPDYWNEEGVAYLDQLVFKPYADMTSEFNALKAGDVDFAQTVLPNDALTLESDTGFQTFDRGDSCNVAVLQMNHTHKPMDNKDIRRAIAHALNKDAYIQAFYAGEAVPADNWMPPSTQFFKALNLPKYDVQAAKDAITASGLSGDQLKLTLHYPSDVSRPYMPDPKGLAEAIATDLEAAGFTVEFQTAGWRTGYLADEAEGKYPMWLLGWTCDWAGPDNFLNTAFFHPDGTAPNKEFAYGPPALFDAFGRGLTAPSEEDQRAAWEEAQDILAADLPTVPLVNSEPRAAGKASIRGFTGAGNLNELFNTVWLAE